MREMILASTTAAREQALARLLPHQRKDFEDIFEVMDGRPVTIRTIDPPLHEFLPGEESAQRQLAENMGVSYETVKIKVESFREFNPMIGFRGCRLGIVYPEITEMQAQAIFEAAANVIGRGKKVVPEVMIPLVGNVKELENQASIVRRVAQEVMASRKLKFRYQIGTMIEVPRGALTADEIARSADFFSFGTNDLTQTTLALSRDDADRFLVPYLQSEIYLKDPFLSLDRAGVGELMRIAMVKGRATRPEIKIGICGEHGGDPTSIEFCHQLEQDYVSCSPFRVPIARLAAAQAAIKAPRLLPGRSKKTKGT
jgi:pyruvate,orthophosphate dikinase